LAVDNTRLLFHLGKAFTATGNIKNAKAVFCRVLDLDPNHEEAFGQLVEMEMTEDQKK